MMRSNSAPSSGPSGHLLPVGEKRENAAFLCLIIQHSFGALFGTRTYRLTFPPSGEKAPQGQDEGNPATRQKFQNREQKQ
jgi:hypothetical protein